MKQKEHVAGYLVVIVKTLKLTKIKYKKYIKFFAMPFKVFQITL
jgi:hypothetical protein